MAEGEKRDRAPAQPQIPETDGVAVVVSCIRPVSNRTVELPELDRLVDELQARSASKAAEGAFTSPPTPPPCDANSSREEVGLERVPAEFPPTVPLGGNEKTARSRAGRLALLLISHRFELGQIRRPLVPVAILSAVVGIGVVSMMVLAPENATTPVTTNDHALSDAPVVAAQDRQPQELSASLGNMAELQRQEQPVQEPITPKLVKTVRIYEPVDQLAPNTGLWGESAVANASIDERLHAGEGDPGRSEEAVIETEGRAADSERWPVAIASEDAQSEEPTAGPTGASDLPGTLAQRAAGPAPGPAPAHDLPAEGDESAVAAAAPQEPAAEPARFAPVTTHVNMRSGPASDAAVVRVVPAGARVGVVACENWCEVVFEGERGWVHRSFVAGTSRDGDVRQIAAGTPLISADGAQLGVIRGRSTDAAGQAFIVVDLAQELKAADRSVRLRSEHIVPADGQARINVTRAQFVRSLP